MRVVVAKAAGFCWGVQRAMDSALEAHARWGQTLPVQTIGPLIHNPQALEHLARRGVRELTHSSLASDGVVVVRAHGIPLDELQCLMEKQKQNRQKVVNATCPAVARVQADLRRHASKGGFAILLGQTEHPEVVAHRSYATAGCAVIGSLAEAKTLPGDCLPGALLVAQTTFSIDEFQRIVTHLKARCPTLRWKDTICRDTAMRQAQASRLLADADEAVVVGGKQSNNTRHLVEIARQFGLPVQWVEGSEELDLTAVHRQGKVVVLAGASTPSWTVDEVVEVLESAGQAILTLSASRTFFTLQLPVVIGLASLSWLLQHELGWHGWAGPMLPATFHLALCACLPYLDPLGLDRKGRVNGRFLARNRGRFLGLGALAGISSLVAAAAQGWWVLTGVILTAGMAVAGVCQWPDRPWGWIRRIPSIRDLAQAAAPTFLAILLPWFQGRPGTELDVLTSSAALFCLALAAHSTRHLRTFRANHILGREILPVAIGSRATRWIALGLTIFGLGAVFITNSAFFGRPALASMRKH